jgi:hypothetical protein
MSKMISPVNQEQAWAMACAAYRLNGNKYFKVGQVPAGQKTNQELVREIIDDTSMLTEEDREQGQQVRDYISKVVTVATLKGTLDSWGQEMARVSQLDVVETSYDLHIIVSLPQTYARYLERERVHDRLNQTNTDYVAHLGDKIELDVEVLENKYSQKWATYYVTVVDTSNRAWYFAHRQSLKKGEQYTIRGTVKRLADRMVQLNRVKLVSNLDNQKNI